MFCTSKALRGRAEYFPIYTQRMDVRAGGVDFPRRLCYKGAGDRLWRPKINVFLKGERDHEYVG